MSPFLVPVPGFDLHPGLVDRVFGPDGALPGAPMWRGPLTDLSRSPNERDDPGVFLAGRTWAHSSDVGPNDDRPIAARRVVVLQDDCGRFREARVDACHLALDARVPSVAFHLLSLGLGLRLNPIRRDMLRRFLDAVSAGGSWWNEAGAVNVADIFWEHADEIASEGGGRR